MNQLFNIRQVKILASIMAGMFLAIHVLLLAVFQSCGVIPMSRINVVSILFYLVMLGLIHKERLLLFVVLTFFEICVHMCAAIAFVGFDSGFQIVLIGICVLLFYSEYIARSLKLKYVRSIILAPVAMLFYLAGYLISIHREPPYLLPPEVKHFFQIIWCVVVFMVAILILQLFVYVSTRYQESLSNEVFHDKLTGLPNRYAMAEYFTRLGSGTSAESHWLAIADLDDFKHINDTYGHNCGDYVLKEVAAILRKICEGISICRWGGEEFLMAGVNEEETALLERVREAVTKHAFVYEGRHLRMSVTIGMAMFRQGQSIDEWIDAADKKLYEGKTAGKNRLVR